jgi:hypothetical protein
VLSDPLSSTGGMFPRRPRLLRARSQPLPAGAGVDAACCPSITAAWLPDREARRRAPIGARATGRSRKILQATQVLLAISDCRPEPVDACERMSVWNVWRERAIPSRCSREAPRRQTPRYASSSTERPLTEVRGEAPCFRLKQLFADEVVEGASDAPWRVFCSLGPPISVVPKVLQSHWL